MSAGDFPHLRATVRESAIGSSAAWLLNAIAHAAGEARVTRAISAGRRSARAIGTVDAVRYAGFTLAIAAIAGWTLSLLIPRYLGTTIPAAGFFAAATAFAAAAAWPSVVVDTWSQSRLRRVSLWLREP